MDYYAMRKYRLLLHNNSDVTNIILNKLVGHSHLPTKDYKE